MKSQYYICNSINAILKYLRRAVLLGYANKCLAVDYITLNNADWSKEIVSKHQYEAEVWDIGQFLNKKKIVFRFSGRYVSQPEFSFVLEIVVDLVSEVQFVYVTFRVKGKKSINTFYSVTNAMRQCKIELNQLMELSSEGRCLKFYFCFHSFSSFIDSVFK